MSFDPTSAEAFETKYRSQPDPWDFASSSYERGRYGAIMAALRRPAYTTAYEPGCSVGELTALLALRCENVFAADLSMTAVERARARCREYGNVRIDVAPDPQAVPAIALDLIVFSELGYYFDSATLARFATRLACSLVSGGEFIAAHWLGTSPDHRLHGDEVHAELVACLPLKWVGGERHPGFRIDSWVRDE